MTEPVRFCIHGKDPNSCYECNRIYFHSPVEDEWTALRLYIERVRKELKTPPPPPEPA